MLANNPTNKNKIHTMKISNASNYEIARLMGSDATDEQAARLIEIMTTSGITDTDEISDDKFFELVAEACRWHPATIN
jgi:hypothetical protein